MAVEPLVERRELLDRAADRAARAGGVLHQQPRRVVRELEHLLHRRQHARHARLEAGAEMRADVEDDAVGSDRARDLHRVAERRDRLLVDVVVGRREVAEVERVAEDAVQPDLRAPLAEAVERRRVVIRRPPCARALREHLERLGADRLCAVDGGVDAARGDDRCAPMYTHATLPKPRLRDSAASSSTARRAARGRGAYGSIVDLALLVGAPAARDDAVDEERLRDVAVLRDHGLAQLLGQHAAAVGVREQRVVPLRQEAHRRRRRRRPGAGRAGRRAARGRSRRGSGAAARALRARRRSPSRAGPTSRRCRRASPGRRRRGSAARAPSARRARPSARARDRRERRRAAGRSRAPTPARAEGARACAPRGRCDGAWSRPRARAPARDTRAPSLWVSGACSASLRAPGSASSACARCVVVVPRRHVAERRTRTSDSRAR